MWGLPIWEIDFEATTVKINHLNNVHWCFGRELKIPNLKLLKKNIRFKQNQPNFSEETKAEIIISL